MRKITEKVLTRVRRCLEEERAGRQRKAVELARCWGAAQGPPEPVAGDEGDLALASLSEQLEHLELCRISSSMRTIEAALLTMELGRYGVCLRCDEPIPVRRLHALPTAILCRECQAAAEAVRAGCGV